MHVLGSDLMTQSLWLRFIHGGWKWWSFMKPFSSHAPNLHQLYFWQASCILVNIWIGGSKGIINRRNYSSWCKQHYLQLSSTLHIHYNSLRANTKKKSIQNSILSPPPHVPSLVTTITDPLSRLLKSNSIMQLHFHPSTFSYSVPIHLIPSS